MRRLILLTAVAAALATGCASSPDSPWATDPDVPSLPTPTTDLDDARSTSTEGGDAGGPIARPVIERECFSDEIRCGLVSVPQTEGAPDLVTLEFRVLADSGSGVPLVQLLDGRNDGLITPEAFPDRPIILIGARGLHPGGPNLSCPEFFDANSNADIGALIVDCTERLELAGIDPAGTVPSRLGADVALVVESLGYEQVDLIVPSWRALSTPAIASRIDVRRVVYTSPWFATDRALAPTTSALVSMEAVWEQCASTPTCNTPGTVPDFLAAIATLDAQPLEDVNDFYSDEPRPIDAARLVGAILSTGDRVSDITFLPQLHQAILDRDADTVSSFVQAASSSSTEVNLLGVTCSLFDPATATTEGLPSPLREDADDGIETLDYACAAWPADDSRDETPVPGLSVITRSKPVDGADYAASLVAGPVIVEPTIGLPTNGCLRTAALAWFDHEEIDDTGCSAPLRIAGRNEEISLVPGVYEAFDATIELSVPESWHDSGYGTWWREADPVDETNLDVYSWGADNAEVARSQVIEDWLLTDSVLSSTQIGDQIWLLANASDESGFAYQVATADIDDINVAIILQSDTAEAARLTDDVLLPLLATVTVS